MNVTIRTSARCRVIANVIDTLCSGARLATTTITGSITLPRLSHTAAACITRGQRRSVACALIAERLTFVGRALSRDAVAPLFFVAQVAAIALPAVGTVD